MSHIHRIPWIGQKLEAPFKEFLAKQKDKLHRKSEAASTNVSNYGPYVLNVFVDSLVLITLPYKLFKLTFLLFTGLGNTWMGI